PAAQPIHRTRALYFLLETAMGPVASSQAHLDVIESLISLIADAAAKEPAGFQAFLDQVEASDYLRSVQHDALDLLTRFLGLASEFRALLTEWDTEQPDRECPENLWIDPSDRFHDLKALY